MSFTLESTVVERVPAWTEESGWHEAVWYNPNTDEQLVNIVPPLLVTKSSFLVRRWGVCTNCFNQNHEDSCKHCLVGGKSTGAEPGTAGEWEVGR